MTLYSVPFVITGRIEVEAEDEDDALDQVTECGARQLIDDGLEIAIDLETPELQE